MNYIDNDILIVSKEDFNQKTLKKQVSFILQREISSGKKRMET